MNPEKRCFLSLNHGFLKSNRDRNMLHKIKKLFSKTASIQAAFVVLFLLYATSDSKAVDWDKFLESNPHKITPAEFQALPDYCQTKLYYHNRKSGEGRKSKKNQKWRQVFRSDYSHLHHYCWGLVKLSRANNFLIGSTKRDFTIAGAGSEFDYVIKNVVKNSPFLWRYHQKKGEVLLLQNKNIEAQMEFKKANILRARSKR